MSMTVDIFSEIQGGGEWERAAERDLIESAVTQARLADQLGYGCWWQVEHHGLTTFSLSSAPELVNTLIARETENIHIGHAGVLSPFGINHPLKVAARASFIDMISDGRLELGLARSSANEWENFGVDGTFSRPMTEELFRMLPRMFDDGVFEWHSDLIDIPPIEVVPKPVQRPHPPFWLTGTSADAFTMAGRLGVGGIATTLLWPVSNIGTLVDTYREAIASCDDPAGDVVNNQFGNFTFVHCAPSREEAIQSGAAKAALWYVNKIPKVFSAPRSLLLGAIRGLHTPNREEFSYRHGTADPDAEVIDPDDPVPIIRLINRVHLGMEIDPVEAFEVLDAIDSVVIGDPDTCRAKMKRFEEVGVDRLLCLHQFGGLSHDDAMNSIRLLGEEVLPSFAN